MCLITDWSWAREIMILLFFIWFGLGFGFFESVGMEFVNLEGIYCSSWVKKILSF